MLFVLKIKKWYHGTTESNLQSILEKGFWPSEGLYGTGVYFSSSREGASIFGDAILTTCVDLRKAVVIDIDDWAINEENMPSFLKEEDHVAVIIQYDSGEVELCVYDPSLILHIEENGRGSL